jgi:putative flippase GtrA
MIQQFMSRQFLVFLATGGFAALVNFSSRIILNRWLSFSYSVIVAYGLGMITAYALAKIFVFKESKQSAKASAAYFVLVNIVAAAQTWIISMGLAYYLLPLLGLKVFVSEIAHLCGVIFPVFTSYLGHKHLSFKS